MTKSSRKSVRNGTIGLNERPASEFAHDHGIYALDHTSFQALITTAVLAATAFRLRDQDGLTAALRLLVQAVRPFAGEPMED
jgi:hypothetical protein